MLRFVMITSLVFTIFQVTFVRALQYQEYIPERDDWFMYKDRYTDLPRIFNDHTPCPAKDFYFDCNDAICGNDGKSLVTYKSCPTPQIYNWVPGQECPANKPFYVKCNECQCGPDGKSATCEQKNCPIRRHKEDPEKRK